MTINELAKEIHDNAKAHGWWDEDRDEYETNALIHSEWSEALEEARAGRRLVWYGCKEDGDAGICDGFDCLAKPEECIYRKDKPEGIAVELIDGCIRILDFFGKREMEATDEDGKPSTIESLYSPENAKKAPDKVPTLIAILHAYTAQALMCHPTVAPNAINLLEAMAIAMSWVAKQGLDPLKILLEKHESTTKRVPISTASCSDTN